MVIADKQTPLVILIGQHVCGKTSVLIRLSRFLMNEGWRVSPLKNFHPNSRTYQFYCDAFVRMVFCDDLSQWCSIPDILLEVIDNRGRKVCQLLKYDSERFLDENTLTNDSAEVFSRHQGNLTIIPFISDYPKDVHLFIDRVRKAQSLIRTVKGKVRWLFLYNKIDLMFGHYWQIKDGYQYVKHMINYNYPGLFDSFRASGFHSLWSPYNCSLMPFSSGHFVSTTTPSGKEIDLYLQSPECVPNRLWDYILKGL